MERREFLRALPSVLLPSIGVVAARAAATCGADPRGGIVCDCGIPPERLNTIYGTQDCPMWCWAASAAMIFGYYGMSIIQEEIVATAYGQLACSGANEQIMLVALNRVWNCRNGNFRVFGDTFTVSPASVVQDLTRENPVFIGIARRHVVVLTGARYVQTPYGPDIQAAIVRDPAPGSGGRRVLNPQEWYGISFAARVRVQPV